VFFRRFLVAALVVVFLAGGFRASAHEPFEITTDVRPRGEGIEVRMQLAWSTCLRACNEGKTPEPWMPPEEFEQQRELITKQAAGFFVVKEDGHPLPVRNVRVELTVENDIAIAVVFVLPKGEGTVRFDAAVLQVLPREGYGSQFTILARDGAFLGQQTLWAETPVFELPAAALR
jgi:hypothetical protein